jgi:hypothetical protein
MNETDLDNAIASAILFLQFANSMKKDFQKNPGAGSTNSMGSADLRGLIKHQARILSHLLAKLRK